MEKTLASVGRAIDNAADFVDRNAVSAAEDIYGGAESVVTGVYDTAKRFGRNVGRRSEEPGLIMALMAPAQVGAYGLVAGAIDTIRGR